MFQKRRLKCYLLCFLRCFLLRLVVEQELSEQFLENETGHSRK